MSQLPTSPLTRRSLLLGTSALAAATALPMRIAQASPITLTFAKHKVEIRGVAQDVGEAEDSVTIKYSGKEIAISFNPDFLMDPLRNLSCDEVGLELTDELSPGVLTADTPFKYVLMPMRVR